MKKILKKYNGAILLYLVIILGVLVLNARFKYLNNLDQNLEKVNYQQIAMGD